jgi:hypothetical protein
MRKLSLAVIVVLVGVASAYAQGRTNPTGTIPPLRGPLPTGSVFSLPTIGLPLPQIGLQPMSDGWRRADGRVDARGAAVAVQGFGGLSTRHRYNVGIDHRSGVAVRGGFGVPVVPAYGYAVAPVYGYPFVYGVAGTVDIPVATQTYGPQTSIEAAPPQVSGKGVLVLDVTPSTAELYVDGYYTGRLDDLRGQVALDPGPHKIDLVADGYERAVFNVNIESNRAISFKRDLRAVEQQFKVAPPTGSTIPKTFYLVPGCYLGDVPPKDAHLPSNCDVSKAVTFTR